MVLNRTNAYLKRILVLESATFVRLLLSVEDQTIGFFCDDFLFRKVTKKEEEYLFMKIKYSKLSYFSNFLRFIKKTSPYYTDYVSSIYESHVIVFKIKPEFIQAVKHFKKGEYSKMYTKEQFTKLKFSEKINKQPSNVYRVLTKNPDAYPYLCDMITKRYGTTTYPPKDEVKEFDLPPNQEDYLNYNKR